VQSPHRWNPEGYSKSSSAQYEWAMALIEGISLRGDERILDIGCGDGRISAHLARLVPEGSVVGLDSSADMICYARSAFSGIHSLSFQLGDASSLPFEEEFDLAVSFACLHWIADQLPVLEGVRRSLVPGGRFVMQCGGRGNAARVFDLTDELTALPQWRSYLSGFPFPYHFYLPEDYRVWLAQAGLLCSRAELVGREMVHQGQEGLEGWIRNTWLPYTERLPDRLRGGFVSGIAAAYLERYPLDELGRSHVQMVRLEVEADRPA